MENREGRAAEALGFGKTEESISSADGQSREAGTGSGDGDRRRAGVPGSRHCGGGRSEDCSTAAEGAERPGNPRKQQWCILTPARRREGVPGPQAFR